MPYPFYETLEYPHQFRQARKEGERLRANRDDIRKERRHARKMFAQNSSADVGFDIVKPGKWIGRYYQSSGAYRSAYAFVRSEANYYDQADY